MSVMLDKLDVVWQILQDCLVLDLKEGVDTTWEEHISTIGLPIQTRLLQHNTDDPAEVDEHRQFGLGCLVSIQLDQLLDSVLDSHWVYSSVLANRQIEMLLPQEALMNQRLLDVLLIELYLECIPEEVGVQVLHDTVLDAFPVELHLLLCVVLGGEQVSELLVHCIHQFLHVLSLLLAFDVWLYYLGQSSLNELFNLLSDW
jgi:hypothetical protein